MTEIKKETKKEINIVARKPREFMEFAVIDRGEGTKQRYVSATISPDSLAHGEWFWGHYFDTLKEALAHFDGRKVY